MWYEKTKALRENGQLQLVGLIQEQHPERCSLFMQWQQMEFPVMVDSLNVLNVAGVPSFALFDEHGVLIEEKLRADDFDESLVTNACTAPDTIPAIYAVPDLTELKQQAELQNTATTWCSYGEALFNYTADKHLAVNAFEQATHADSENGIAWFRLGAALQWRSESEYATEDDSQRARSSWGRARELDPNQYIWRRRLQQYGAVRNKPYSLYGWIGEARESLEQRGETPLPLRVALTSSELATLDEQQEAADTLHEDPDPKDRIHRDDLGMVNAQIICTPEKVAPGQAVHVQILLSLDPDKKGHWNNEVDDLQIWLRPPDDWQALPQLISIPNPQEDTSVELRSLECELIVGKSQSNGPVSIPCFALYYLCEDVDGTCLYLRKDMLINLEISQQALALG